MSKSVPASAADFVAMIKENNNRVERADPSQVHRTRQSPGDNSMTKHFKMGRDHRMRDSDGEIREKRADTLVRTLRDEYGPKFAPDVRSNTKLGSLKERIGAERLNDVLKHYGIKR